MKAQQVSTIIISLNDLTLVQAALDKLRKGQSLTAGDSGTIAYGPDPDGSGPFGNAVEMACPPAVLFDGFNWNVFLFYLSG